MSPEIALALGRVTTAHPESSHPHVDVPLVLVLVGSTMAVVLAAVATPTRTPGSPVDPEQAGTTSWAGRLTGAQWAVRSVALTLMLLAVVAGRVGVDDELENLAPALVVGAGFPLVVVGCLVVGGLWRWLDPWDTLARLIGPGDSSEPPSHVWPAVAVALPWLWFLSVHSRPLDPRAVGLVLALYTVLTVAGSLVVGRRRWLASAEPVGLLLSWVGLLPRRRLSGWAPPAGAAALLGVLVGGLLFGLVRRTELWSPLAVRPQADLYATAGLLVACAVVGTAATLAGRVGETPASRAVVARALVPVTAGVVLVAALARNRLSTSLQLLPGLLGDPFGEGWDLLGSPTDGLDPAPLGAAGLVAAQIAVVALAHLLAAATAPRALVGDERLAVIVVVTASVAVSVTAVSLH